ncbi:MAG: hypothetical protein QOE26_873 [Verrucomicrobiota bacterium]|jgi:hypothetical protein
MPRFPDNPLLRLDELAAVIDKIFADPELENAFFCVISMLASEQANSADEEVFRKALRTAARPADRRFVAKILLELAAKKQKRDAQ